MLPHYCSPYNAEKRRLNEEQAMMATTAAAKQEAGAAAAAVTMPPAYRDMELILFPEGSLRDCNGNIVSQQHLIGKSVGLYFADSNSPKCRSFLPFLLQFYRTVNEGGSYQKIEVIFVSVDKDESSYLDHRKHMPWLSIDFNNPLRTILLRHFRIGDEFTVPSLGEGHRAGLPALVVVGADGRDAQFLQVGGGRDEGERAILRWDWRNTKFGADRFLVRREG